MAVTPYEQRSYPGAAADTTLASGITSAALSFTVATGDGVHYPDGSGGPFWVVIDYDVSTTEKLHCTSRSGDLFTVDVRGADGTTAQAHSLGAKVRACWTATDAQEANRAASNTVGKITTKGDLLVGTGANTMARLAVGIDGTTATADSTQTTGFANNRVVIFVDHGSTAGATRPAGAQVVLWEGTVAPTNAATNDLWWDKTNQLIKRYTGSVFLASGSSTYAPLSGAWTTWSPVITGATTNPTYTDNGSAYRVDGKTMLYRLSITYVTSGTGQYTLTVPGGFTAQLTYGVASLVGPAPGVVVLTSIASGNHIQFLTSSNSGYGSTSFGGTPTLAFSGVIELT